MAQPGTTNSSEALLKSRVSTQDPSFSQMKLQFSVDFDSSAPGALKLHNLILRLRKWIKILETKTKAFAK
jgi:transformation/transcription domain-associated protein